MPAESIRKLLRKTLRTIVLLFVVIGLAVAALVVFFDEAILVRKGTVYRVANGEKLVALTFDDGPSPVWTPQILDELKKADVKATFFMTGQHAEKYPAVAKAVAVAGHEIGNHSYDHHVLLYYTPQELEKEIKDAQQAIKEATGRTTTLFRPPKAWITGSEKTQIRELGYHVVLWSLNSKDWVTFDDEIVVSYLTHAIAPGDIILFHDSGGVFSTEGGDRHETVKTIPDLVAKLRTQGYQFVTVSELLERSAGTKSTSVRP